MKKPIGYFLGEGALIVFSILLALGLNGWREWAGEKAEERQAIASIYAEISDNLELLSDLPEYHHSLAEELQAAIAAFEADGPDENRTPMEIFISTESLHRDSMVISRGPQGVAWELAKQRGVASRFDYELAKRLSLVYSAQDAGLVPLYDKAFELLASPAMFSSKDQAAALWPMVILFSEMAARERTVVAQLENIQAQIADSEPVLKKQAK